MYFKCCVRNCESTRQDAVLHKFPSNGKRASKWLECIRGHGDDGEIQQQSLKNLFICHKHFQNKFIGKSSKLLCGAYPTLFSPNEIISGQPVDCQDAVHDMEIDHTYARTIQHLDHTYAAGTHSTTVPDAETSTRDRIEVSSKPLAIIGDNSLPNVNPCITTTPTTKKSCRKRIVKKLKNLTPACKKLYKEFAKAKKQADFHRRAKQAMKYSKDGFEAEAKNMNPYDKKFLRMQINLCKKKKKRRRFTLDEKLISLAIMKQSPKCYRFLHKIFILPSTSTLNKMVSNLDISTGINKRLFDMIRKEVETWPESKKLCSIIYDEMSLGTGLSYDGKHDEINGFVQLNDRKHRFADHVLVFMARGAAHKWQQPLAYYFCEGATSGPELKTILKSIVSAVAETGLKPIVLGCDQGSSFQSAIKSLQQDTRREQLRQNQEPGDTIIIGDSKLNIIYDPSHLIKGIRNNFISKDITFQGKISKWQDIVDVYNTDCSHSDMRLLHKLNDEHVIPNKIKKMKVKNCVRVLSKTVAAALIYTSQFGTYADGTPISSTIKNTAETVAFFDDLFDSINGATTSIKTARGKRLRTAVRESSEHHKFWLEAIGKIEKIKYLDKGVEKTVPTLKNFVTTLKSYKKLWQVFQSNDLKIMRPRYFNTDPIENFFGQTRAYNYRNNDPTCQNFISTYKALIITRVIKFHSDSYNCEDDQADQLITLKSLFNDDSEDEQVSHGAMPGHSTVHDVPIVPEVEGLLEKARRERLSTHSRAYTTGWVVRKVFEKMPDCTQCKSDLTSCPGDSIHNWVSHREYKETVRQKKLNYPSSKAVRYFGMILNHTNDYLEENGHRTKIINTLRQTFSSQYSFELVDCPEHQDFVAKYFQSIVMRLTIYTWCNRLNKILKGVDISRLREQHLTATQKRKKSIKRN